MKNHPPVSYEYATFAIKLIAVSAIIAVFKPFFFHDAMDGRQKGNATVAKVNALRNHVGAFHSSACAGNHAWVNVMVIKPWKTVAIGPLYKLSAYTNTHPKTTCARRYSG